MVSRAIVLLLVCVICACTEKPVITVDKPVDIKRYAGNWYELASFPTHFSSDCSCTRMQYFVHDHHLHVKNTCLVTVRHKQHERSIIGKATPIPGSQNSYWTIKFYRPLKANYWIIYISDDYQYAAVSEPSKKYLWILGRKPEIDLRTYSKILSKLQDLGFNLNLLEFSKSCSIKTP